MTGTAIWRENRGKSRRNRPLELAGGLLFAGAGVVFMKRTYSAWSNALTAVIVAGALALPASALAQQKAVPRSGGGSQPSGGSGGSGSGGGSNGGSSDGGRSGGQSTPSTPRGANRIPSGDSGNRGGGRTAGRDGGSSGNSGDTGRTTAATPGTTAASEPAPGASRPRDGQPRQGEAVARRSLPPLVGGGSTIFIPGGYYGNYYPWGYGGFGLGGYYGGYYDPWYYGGYQGGGGYYRDDGYEGQLRLKVKPRSAQVFVDGYFAGVVNDFDGVFQRLHIEPGPHRIEVREDGYDSLNFEVRILPDRTVTYSGELKRLTP